MVPPPFNLLATFSFFRTSALCPKKREKAEAGRNSKAKESSYLPQGESMDSRLLRSV
jgi:hypothetical protein